jgi:hypothetical protein
MGVRGKVAGAGAAAALLLAGSAGAQVAQPTQSAQPAQSAEPAIDRGPETERVKEQRRPTGLGLQLGGGVTQFGAAYANDLVDLGGAWDARVTYGMRSILGVEAAYVGSAQMLSDESFPSDAYLLGNGAEAAARLNLPVKGVTWSLVPYVLLGMGWNNYQAINLGESILMKGSDNVLTIPVGAGLTAAYWGFILDARFTYRQTLDDDLFVNKAGMHGWTAGAHIGRQF